MSLDLFGVFVQTCEFLVLVVLGIYDYFCSLYHLFIQKTPKCLKNETILVTGAASGIGREVCIELVNSGAKKLVLWDYNKITNEKTASELRALGATVFAYEVDVSDRNNVSIAANKVRQEVGDVTMLYNNAGVTHICDMLDQDPDELERTIQINLISHFWTIREFLPKMIEKGTGHIVTTCSTLGLKATQKGVAYSASKFGVRGFVEALKCEMRHHPLKPDIHFTTAYPFFVDTPLINGLQVTYRLPFLFGHLTVHDVAIRIVDGIRTNLNSVHIPRHIPYLLFLENLGPRKTAERCMDFFIKEIKLGTGPSETISSNGHECDLKSEKAMIFQKGFKPPSNQTGIM